MCCTHFSHSLIIHLLLFNHIISRFGIPRAIVTNHGSHFQNKMMAELSVKLGFHHNNSTPYYPQANGQVEAINKVLKTMLQRMVGQAKSKWHFRYSMHSGPIGLLSKLPPILQLSN